MSSRKTTTQEYFETFKFEEGEVVCLGGSKACKIHSVGTVRLMLDKCEFLIHNIFKQVTSNTIG